MPDSFPDLPALIGSRICHDLISPIGAIGNGVELLSMSGLNSAPEVALISESVQSASARIRFFRIAFGSASSDQTVGHGEILSILQAMTAGSKKTVTWDADGPVARTDARLIFLIILCVETAMPWGGRLTVARAGDGWTVTGRAEAVKLDHDLWRMVADGVLERDVTSAEVHFPLAVQAARQIGRLLKVSTEPVRITVSF